MLPAIRHHRQCHPFFSHGNRLQFGTTGLTDAFESFKEILTFATIYINNERYLHSPTSYHLGRTMGSTLHTRNGAPWEILYLKSSRWNALNLMLNRSMWGTQCSGKPYVYFYSVCSEHSHHCANARYLERVISIRPLFNATLVLLLEYLVFMKLSFHCAPSFHWRNVLSMR